MWHSGLLAKLERFGIAQGIISLFESSLTERKLSVVLNRLMSKYHKVGVNVRQESVVCPSLWRFFFKYILDLIPQA